ncbi:MAG: class I adenylate-forming enzyme family protein [Thermodesulfobacteriota bacterium]|nr:class I adenylate-forming enzyme family protein [Thermodesulfobacteriota bacterium]
MHHPVQGFLESSSIRYPDKKALIHGNASLTFEEVNAGANRLANLLLDRGLQKGARVLMVMENSMDAVIGYYGILKAGGVAVEVPDKSTTNEVSYYLKNCAAKICILSKAAIRRLDGFKCPISIGPVGSTFSSGQEHITWDALDSKPDTKPDIPIDPHDLAAIVYTSGSTGRPKGVMLSHNNLYSNTASIVSYLGLTEHDRIMAVLPFYYVYGKTLLNTHFMAGGSVVINNRFAFPNTVIKDMVAKEVTGFAGVPSTFAILLNRSVFSKTQIPTLRYITQAGGAMSPALTRRLIEHCGPAEVFIMYGATEASARLTYLPPDRLVSDKPLSIGIPIPGVEITIRDNEGRELEAGKVGNLCAVGPNIMQGYWQDSLETSQVLTPWGLVTGDLGYKDADGFIYLTGREKQMLKIGGERVSPKEIEDAIMESGMVHEVAVISRPDEYLSEVPEAFIVPMDPNDFDLDKLVSFTRKRLSVHKHPKHWNIVRNIPKKPSGKIDKKALRP